MAVEITRRAWTVDEYERMAEAGILTEDDRVELIEGEIVQMSPIGSRHAACVNRVAAWLQRKIGQDTIISVQNPIRLNDYTEPQPDIAVLRLQADFYAPAHPTPADVLLVIEVAETSLAYDRDVKLPRYAEAQIPEVWLIDLAGATVTHYAQPRNGVYADVHPAQRGEVLIARTFPNVLVPVDDLVT